MDTLLKDVPTAELDALFAAQPHADKCWVVKFLVEMRAGKRVDECWLAPHRTLTATFADGTEQRGICLKVAPGAVPEQQHTSASVAKSRSVRVEAGLSHLPQEVLEKILHHFRGEDVCVKDVFAVMGTCRRLRAAALQAELEPITHLQFHDTSSSPNERKDINKFIQLINLVAPFVKSIVVNNEKNTPMPDVALTAKMPNLHSLSLACAEGLADQLAAASPNVRYLTMDESDTEYTRNWMLQLPLVKLELSWPHLARHGMEGDFASTTMQAVTFSECAVSASAILSILRSSRRTMESLSLRGVSIVGAEEEYDDDGGGGCSFVDWLYCHGESAGLLRRICTRNLIHLHLRLRENQQGYATSLFGTAQFSLRRLVLQLPAGMMEAVLPTIVERNPGLETLCIRCLFLSASVVSPVRQLVHLVALSLWWLDPAPAVPVLALIGSSSLKDLTYLKISLIGDMNQTLRQACFEFRARMPHVSVNCGGGICSHRNFDRGDAGLSCGECQAAKEPYGCCVDLLC